MRRRSRRGRRRRRACRWRRPPGRAAARPRGGRRPGRRRAARRSARGAAGSPSGGKGWGERSAGEARRSVRGALSGEVELVDQAEAAAGLARRADQPEAGPLVHPDRPTVAESGGQRDPVEPASPRGGEHRVQQRPAGAVPARLGKQEDPADLAAGGTGAPQGRGADDPAAGVGGHVEGAAAGRIVGLGGEDVGVEARGLERQAVLPEHLPHELRGGGGVRVGSGPDRHRGARSCRSRRSGRRELHSPGQVRNRILGLYGGTTAEGNVPLAYFQGRVNSYPMADTGVPQRHGSRTVGVLGASGYAGAELLRLLAAHPDLEVIWASGESSAGRPVAARYPGLASAYGALAFSSTEETLDKGTDVLFMALPHGQAATLATRALAGAGLVVDLSADFRLHRPDDYPAWYGGPHPLPAELGSWPYGLPELHRSELLGATKVAVPGCYPTAALLALAPLVAAGLVEADGIVIDAKSGISGAGRSLKDAYLFVQANENVNPYGVGTHRHTPEIEQELGRAAGRPLTVVFTPHLVPLGRGLLATCYGALAPGAGRAELSACLADAYGDEPFVDLVGPDGHPGLQGTWPSTRAVATTNRAQVAATADPRTGRLVAAAAIDNLVKGAAGQAVQCANLALGLPETTGLELVPPGP